ncbi:MAG: AAA family ATPase [Patescibacteria group bacterium]|nr:AAA family ATPase [Patescibacteria group bacterium]
MLSLFGDEVFLVEYNGVIMWRHPTDGGFMPISELSPEQLRKTIDPSFFQFKSTKELPELKEVIGQGRAMAALRFGVSIPSFGYNLFALGVSGTGKMSIIKQELEKEAAKKNPPDDWCYVYNFDNADSPRYLRLPAGKGKEFKKDMDSFVEDFQNRMSKAFESENYEKQAVGIAQEVQEKRRVKIKELETRAGELGFTIVETPLGVVVAPVLEGRPIMAEEIEQLPPEKKEKVEASKKALQDEMTNILREINQLEKESREKVKKLDETIILFVVQPLTEELKEKYQENKKVTEYLEKVKKDILSRAQELKDVRKEEGGEGNILEKIISREKEEALDLDRYKANVIVDNSSLNHAPVIHETLPTAPNLIGRSEYKARLGVLMTDFTLIKGGSLQRANGGYLVLDVMDILRNPFAWESLKNSLRNKEVNIEDMTERIGIGLHTATLRPEPIPLDVKVVLVGSPFVYYLLYLLDEDFPELFKVKVDFDVETNLNEENMEKYAQFVAERAREDNLKSFSPSAVAKLVEQGSRLVEDKNKVSVRFLQLGDLVRESSYWAQENENSLVEAEDVEKAIGEKIYRSNLIEEKLREMIADGTLFIDVTGEVIGQVNGISILSLGDYTFGKPSRITAKTFVGKEGVFDIERKTQLGGKIYGKGVLILSNYLGAKFAQDVPLALSASLTFEQTYEEVEGDSASSTELYALLSSLSDLPLKQNLAVTGSVDQHGQVQPVGGINQKIEGYFDVCKIKGLTGDQGVLIPAENVKNLMLREDVVSDVKNKQFHIYPIKTIDQGIELLAGRKAGERKADGSYPEGTVNAAVRDKLESLAHKWKDFFGTEART